MRKVNNFDILLKRIEPCYTLGDKVDGFIRFDVSKSVKVKRILLNFVGKGEVEWYISDLALYIKIYIKYKRSKKGKKMET
jgi:hypothetical protein